MTAGVGSLIVCCALLVAPFARAADVTSTWIGPSGEWTDGSLWSTSPSFPENDGVTYAAVVGSSLPTVSVNLSRDLTIDSLSLQNAVFTTSATLSLVDGLTLGDYGRILDGTVVASGTSLFSGEGMQLSSSTFVNQGDASWESGDLTLTGASFENELSATFTVTGSADRVLGGSLSGPFVNDGTFWHLSSGVTTLQSPFENTGQVLVQSGELRLSGSSLGGTLDVAAGATLRLGGHLLYDGFISNEGDLELANIVLDGFAVGGGTTTFLGHDTLSSTSVSGAHRLVVDVDSIGLRVDGLLGVDDLVWRQGRLFGARDIDILAALLIEGDGDKLLEGRELRGDHGILWNGGSIGLIAGASLANGPASTLTVDAGALPLTISGAPGDGWVQNEGELHKVGAGNSFFATRVQGNGSIRVEEGSLQIADLYTDAAAVSIADGATLRLSGTSVLGNAASVSGAGTLRLAGAQHDIRAAFAPAAVVVESGSVRFLEDVGRYTGSFSSLGGSASFDYFPVDLVNVVQLGGGLSLADGSRIGGTIDWSFGRLTSPGAVELYGDATVLQGAVAGAQVVHTGSMSVRGVLTLESGASLLNAPGAEIRLVGQTTRLGEAGAPTGSTAIRNEGLVVATHPAGGGSSVSINSPFVNAGTFQIEGDGPESSAPRAIASFSDFRQTDGTLWLRNGDIQTLTGAPLHIEGGSLIGDGRLFVNVDDHGRIAPGDPGETGRLSFLGLALFGDAELDFEIGGTERGIGFDAIDVRDLFLDGELSVRFVAGFEDEVSAGDVFDIAVASRSLEGALANVASGARLATADGLGSFAVFYGAGSPFSATSVVLTDFRTVPEPGALALLALASVGTLVSRARRRGATPAR